MGNISAVNRARLIDEPVVRLLLEIANPDWHFMQGSMDDDWNHIDIRGYKDNSKNASSFDVKRNSSLRYKSSEFTFTFKNSRGEWFPFTEGNAFVFIDENPYRLIIVPHMVMLNIVNKSTQYKSKQGNSYYIFVSKEELVNNSIQTIIIPNNLILHLERNRNESLFNF